VRTTRIIYSLVIIGLLCSVIYVDYRRRILEHSLKQERRQRSSLEWNHSGFCLSMAGTVDWVSKKAKRPLDPELIQTLHWIAQHCVGPGRDTEDELATFGDVATALLGGGSVAEENAYLETAASMMRRPLERLRDAPPGSQ
jgi:hypothetical protein